MIIATGFNRFWRRTAVLVALGIATTGVALLGPLSPPTVAQTPQVTLYEHTNYGGASRMLAGEVGDLRIISTLGDAVTSLRVPAGVKVSTYEHINFGGICEDFTADDPDLRNNPIGSDRISSLKVGQACPPQVTLYEHTNYGGAFRTLTASALDLASIGFTNMASSAHLTGGARVAAYDANATAGLCEDLTASDPDLRNNPIGSDRISAITLNGACPPQVVVFRDTNYRGDYWIASCGVPLFGAVSCEHPNLPSRYVSDWGDAISSIHVTGGMRVAVYPLPNFEKQHGWIWACIAGDTPDMGQVWPPVGNDNISSMRVGHC